MLSSFTISHLEEVDQVINYIFNIKDESEGQEPQLFSTLGVALIEMYGTFLWAYYEGESGICYDGFEYQEQLFQFVRNFCESRSLDYAIREVIYEGNLYHHLFLNENVGWSVD